MYYSIMCSQVQPSTIRTILSTGGRVVREMTRSSNAPAQALIYHGGVQPVQCDKPKCALEPGYYKIKQWNNQINAEMSNINYVYYTVIHIVTYEVLRIGMHHW